jgi:hypothetical protein
MARTPRRAGPSAGVGRRAAARCGGRARERRGDCSGVGLVLFDLILLKNFE